MSVYDAIYEAVADHLDVPLADVREALLHREIPDDYFWHAWDRVVDEATTMVQKSLGVDEIDPVGR